MKIKLFKRNDSYIGLILRATLAIVFFHTELKSFLIGLEVMAFPVQWDFLPKRSDYLGMSNSW